jgi:CBS domain containing-hemolysin-like protein
VRSITCRKHQHRAQLRSALVTAHAAFVVSTHPATVVITFFGEIFPQAYFVRHAVTMGHWLSPLLRLYQYLLYTVAKPSALLLDRWLGKAADSVALLQTFGRLPRNTVHSQRL